MTEKNETKALVVSDAVPLMDTGKFEQLQRVAQVLAAGSLTPKHLVVPNDRQATIANCLRVANQALRWGFDPFAVADESYVVHGKLGYQGKLVAAVVNTRANLVGRLRYEFEGSGDAMTCTVIGRFADEDFDRTAKLSVKQAKTQNDMWRSDPRQKLIYSATVRWARRHCPEVIAGVLTEDDLEKIRQQTEPKDKPKTIEDLMAQAPAEVETEAVTTEEAAADAQPDELAADDAAETVTEQTPANEPKSPAEQGIIWEALQMDLSNVETIRAVDALEVKYLEHASDAGEEEVCRGLCAARIQAIRDKRSGKPADTGQKELID